MKKHAMLWIYNKIKAHRLSLVLLTLCDGLLSVCVVAFAYLSKGFLDAAVEQGIKGALPEALLLGGVVIAQIVLRFVSGMLSEQTAGKINMSLKNGLFLSALRRNMRSSASAHSGETLNRLFSDTSVISEGIASILPTAAAIVTRLAAVFVVLALFDAYLIIAFGIMGGLLYLLSRLMRPHIKRLHKNMQQAEDRVRACLQEAFDRLVVIKAYGREQALASNAHSRQQTHYRARMDRARLSVLVSSGFVLFFRGAYVAVMIYCAVRLSRGDGEMTFGTLMALLQLVGQVQQPFASLSGIMPRYYAMLSSAERLMQLEQGTESFEQKDTAAIYQKMGGICIEDVTFNYGRERVLEHASAYIPKGSFTLLTAPTGAGKSTLFMLLMGLYDYTGEIRTDAGEGLDGSTRPMFAYVPQGNLLFTGTVRDNVCFARSGSEAEIEQALDISCSSEFVSRLPQGLDTPIGQEGSALSEGQAQRLALARAIMSGAPVLLLDEATPALDDATEKQLLHNLRGLDRTVILISHKSAARDVCTQELALENGGLRQVK